jgi:hypothetical protein
MYKEGFGNKNKEAASCRVSEKIVARCFRRSDYKSFSFNRKISEFEWRSQRKRKNISEHVVSKGSRE